MKNKYVKVVVWRNHKLVLSGLLLMSFSLIMRFVNIGVYILFMTLIGLFVFVNIFDIDREVYYIKKKEEKK